jgi:hypothetical protein
MDRRSFLAISSAVLVATPSFGQDQSTIRHDGNWWKDLNILTKFGYVIGYAEGSAKADATWAYGQCRTKVAAKYLSGLQKVNDFSGIAIGQFIEGLDQFYNDFRNARILSTDAMMIVKLQISGTNQKEIDDDLQIIRKEALNPSY